MKNIKRIIKEEKKPIIQAKSDISAQAESPSPEKPLPVKQEEKKPAVLAKADSPQQTAPVNVVFVPAGVEKAKSSN